MNKLLFIFIFFSVTCKLTALTVADTSKGVLSAKDSAEVLNETADSIMRSVISNAAIYEKTLSKYEADIYIKGRTEILQNNALIRLAHHILPVNRKNRDMLFEMLSFSQFNAPNIYKHEIKAITGNSIPNQKKQQEALNFLNINVYSATLYKEELLTPISPNAFSYYKFKLLGYENYKDRRIYNIQFIPKVISQKLVSGNIYVMDKWWTIDKIDISGRYSFADFNLVMSYCRDTERFILPENADLKMRVNLLGNIIETVYHSNFNYRKIEWQNDNLLTKVKKSLDLTNYYSLSKKEIPIIRNSSYWNHYRDCPLTNEEKRLYAMDTKSEAASDTSRTSKYLEITENLTGSINMDLRSTELRYSGLLNPSQLGYSKLNGVTYRQLLRFTKNYENGRQLRFRPEVGFIFKRKELFLKLSGEFEYCPQRLGYLSFSVGNTYQSYSSVFMQEIKEQVKDSTFNFDKLDLPYFKSYFADIRHNIEVFHGLQAAAGLSYYFRTPSEKHRVMENENINDIVNKDYTDFTPVINLSYTPRQYYRMVGRKKEYMYSFYPTITAEIAQAIPGILNSNGDYCRVEANVQQAVSLGLCRVLSYNVSGGLYTEQKSVYFADFRFFGQSFFPDRWSEEIGGKFHLLKREWYNASDKYVQGHFMYESPFILLHLFKQGMSKYVLSERFYFGQLWTPVLNSYTEVGYGIGNHIFNIAGFVSFKGKEYQRFGLRFAFELF
ncbi:DUF5686 family protein [Massilibacteroides sp.]|uniref:DUF5686 family protein n=1 Tax=Massilibacteroides sp. TaxID=2034766 RepID=UPI0026196325|nr:DUF5686 family protein [Massilibacteroides sp.]MDD4515045.1 DUF5686 family protein [Massilibacteroides sp.]